MELTAVRITDPINWFDRCTWLHANCSECHDRTNWAAWQIGLDDIIFLVPVRDAVEYYLRWT